MSLKAFHLFFIALSIVLAFGFGLWGVNLYSLDGRISDLALGLFSFAGGGALVVYGVKTLQRFRRLG
jgi:hypothetical protein